MSSVNLTSEQFQALLNTIARPISDSGSLAKCASRFDGSKGADVKAFIDAVEIYKECTHVSDANALKGIPMLLDGFAATWFQGVKNTVNTWASAINLLRSTFGPQKPAYRVYRELFSTEQDAKTPCDIFVCKARAIIAQLPADTLTEATQLDMVYGLLHRRIREKVARDKINTFSELLKESRQTEESYENPEINIKNENESKRVRCSFCKNPGHVKDECRKLAAVRTREADSRKSSVEPKPNPPLVTSRTSPKPTNLFHFESDFVLWM
ncbi:activity-regulated cytoskeleton associated protein 2-like [Diabrotica undecimpunctata]|uniref:activity-regulated cytoskeleton associated protein 2-like n=3 Tax=Diabrotica undecimpunctata TaxID=50387 RepID=UPI003B638A30